MDGGAATFSGVVVWFWRAIDPRSRLLSAFLNRANARSRTLLTCALSNQQPRLLAFTGVFVPNFSTGVHDGLADDSPVSVDALAPRASAQARVREGGMK
jgi:hypothetical protein